MSDTVSPAIRVKVNGEDVVIDPRTLTGTERQKLKKALAGIGYEPDANDAIFATIWVVMSRSDPTITLTDVLDAVTMGDLADAEPVDSREDDSPEV